MKGVFYVLVILRVLYLHMVLLMGREEYTRVINLKQGNLQGRIVKPKKNPALGNVEVYLGIPYAAPPVANLRFMPPGAPLQWTDMLNASHTRSVCPQMSPNFDSPQQKKISPERNLFVKRMRPFLRNESEDCLYMNIYVPHRTDRDGKENRRYPIILFIHGESFEWNSGNLYDGKTIAGYGNVIFITINFRLGIFGFLKQGLMVGRANFGLSDQIAALQWTKGNIAEFGGDPSRITVMGHGTGAACVNFLMLSPVAEGLFHRAILMGGSALSEWALTAIPLHYIQLKDELNCSSDNIINCLQKKRKEDIISAFKKYEIPPFDNFTPVVDEIVVLNSPAEQMEKYSLFSNYDLMAGVNEIESYYLLEDKFLKYGMLIEEGRDYLEKYMRIVFKKSPDTALLSTVEQYFGHLKDTSAMSIRNIVLDALSDLLVTAPVLQTIRYHAPTPKNTFFYVFGHRTAFEHTIKTNKSIYGDDLPYALGVPLDGHSYQYQSNYTIQEQLLSETMLRYFTNFAKTGNPYSSTNSELYAFNPHTNTKQNTIQWPHYNTDTQLYMYFGIPPQIRSYYRSEYNRFWNQAHLNALKTYDGDDALAESESHSKNADTVENDQYFSPSIHELGPPLFRGLPTSNGGKVDYSQYNNFEKIATGTAWPPFQSPPVDDFGEIRTADGSSSTSTSTTLQSSSFTATTLIIVAILFLLLNVIAFGFIFYQRGKLRVRENLFRNRFRCKTISVPDLFEENEEGDIYAIAEARRRKGIENAPSNRVRFGFGLGGKKRENTVADTRRVASVKPEAINGKRLRRWPLSRQCSGSTITVDPHSKVRDWIAHEIANACSPRFFRGRRKIVPDTNPDEECVLKEVPPTNARRKPVADKVSVAVDATPAARSGSVLKQIPIEMTKSLDNGKSPLLEARLKSSASTSCICKNKSIDSDDYYRQTRTHKSSARIRLKTPDFTLESVPIAVHSIPDPLLAPETLYSHVNKERKRLKSFADSTRTDESVDTVTPQYEEINVTSCDSDEPQLELTVEQTLCNIAKRNFPKVLPDFPELERRNFNRLSLPPTVFELEEGTIRPSRMIRIPPAPPPRLTSTLGRKPTTTMTTTSPSALFPIGDKEDKQFSQLTVKLKKLEPSVIIEEKVADIIQTESCERLENFVDLEMGNVERDDDNLSQF